MWAVGFDKLKVNSELVKQSHSDLTFILINEDFETNQRFAFLVRRTGNYSKQIT